MERYTISTALIADANEIFELINAAYAVELGDTGVAFKTVNRLIDPLEEQMQQAYDDKTMLKCTDNVTSKIVGILFYEFRDPNLYFGPFAVSPEAKGTGIGKLMLRELKKIGLEKNLVNFEMRVACYRSDLFPMYYKWVSRVD